MTDRHAALANPPLAPVGDVREALETIANGREPSTGSPLAVTQLEDVRRYARQSLAALQSSTSAHVPDGWRPIEEITQRAYDDDECPMFFDLWGPIIGRFPNAYWSGEHKCWVSIAADGSECVSANMRITHFMEMPQRPAQAGRQTT